MRFSFRLTCAPAYEREFYLDQRPMCAPAENSKRFINPKRHGGAQVLFVYGSQIIRNVATLGS